MWPFKKEKGDKKIQNTKKPKEPNPDQEIYDGLEKCLKEFYKLSGKEYLLKDIEDYDLLKNFDEISIYDFECMVEDEFFDGVDIIPDGNYTKIKDFVEFIKKNK